MERRPSKRPAMLASEVREIIAPVLRACPPECGIVSITDVEVSADYGFATLSVSALLLPEQALRYLQSQQSHLRSLLAKRLSLRRAPVVRFRIDRRTERGERIDRLLRETSQDGSEDTSPSSQE